MKYFKSESVRWPYMVSYPRLISFSRYLKVMLIAWFRGAKISICPKGAKGPKKLIKLGFPRYFKIIIIAWIKDDEIVITPKGVSNHNPVIELGLKALDL